MNVGQALFKVVSDGEARFPTAERMRLIAKVGNAAESFGYLIMRVIVAEGFSWIRDREI